MDLGVAASLATQGCTAWYMACIATPLRAGQRVLVHSAAGGVGQWLVQLAVQRGCEVFAIASGTAKRERLLTLGATHVIDRSHGDPARALRSLLGNERLDVSFNAVGGATFKQDLDLLAGGGAVVLFGGAERGAHGGLFGTLRFVWNMGLVVPIFLMMRSKSILGVNMLRIGEQRPALLEECLRATVHTVTSGTVHPHVHRIYVAAELPIALEDLGSGKTQGKVALRW
jgi:NADPH:quinone reductase-like Zn-dependent oxidoreductase